MVSLWKAEKKSQVGAPFIYANTVLPAVNYDQIV